MTASLAADMFLWANRPATQNPPKPALDRKAPLQATRSPR